VLLPEHIKVTSIKETLEKNKAITPENTLKTVPPIVVVAENETDKTTTQQTQNQISETPIPIPIPIEPYQPEIESEKEQEAVFAVLQECWVDAINESSTSNSIYAVEFLSKIIPVENEHHIIEIEVPNEVAKQEIKEITPTLTQCLAKKTGIPYSFDIKVVKAVQEKYIDKSNPDEKFIHLCKENPKLMEFKQRLRLSVS